MKNLFENRVGKYLLYAAGEILLVVIGILIALQINNANQARIEKKALEGHLNTISRNILGDLKRIKQINEKRKSLITGSIYLNNNIIPRVKKVAQLNGGKTLDYTKEDVSYASKLIMSAWNLDYLNANTSGFESLKNSGYLSKLQGEALDSLISDYYTLVEEISQTESDYNRNVVNAKNAFGETDFDGAAPFFNPDQLDWTRTIDNFREDFLSIIESSTVRNTFFIPIDITIDYENLEIIGKKIRYLINSKNITADDTSSVLINRVYDKYGDIGYPKLMDNGLLSSQYTASLASSRNGNRGIIDISGQTERKIEFQAQPWGVVYLYVGRNSIELLETKDFSVYKTLKLELRGENGGEKVLIGMKDESNPTDGSETKIPLELTKDWKTYEIPLTEFVNTNLKKIFMPVSFVFENKAANIYYRHIEYMY